MDLDEVVYAIACGLDVHFAFVAACLVTTGPKGKPKVEEREFPTNQKGLRALRDWLKAGGCEAVGMEATGVYWMPVYAALEGGFELVVGNPQHMKNARGRKTDRMDARWIAGQMRHDRIKPSFVPPPEFRDARELARARRQLIQERTSIRNGIQRLLAGARITLGDLVSNVFGVSGMNILEALAQGKCIQDELPGCLRSTLKSKLTPIAAALEAPLSEVSQYLLGVGLRRLDDQDALVEEVETKLFKHLAPYKAKVDLLLRIPGISQISAHIILAEIGVNMTAWPTEKHFSAWAGVAPEGWRNPKDHPYSRRQGGPIRTVSPGPSRPMGGRPATCLHVEGRLPIGREARSASASAASRALAGWVEPQALAPWRCESRCPDFLGVLCLCGALCLISFLTLTPPTDSFRSKSVQERSCFGPGPGSGFSRHLLRGHVR